MSNHQDPVQTVIVARSMIAADLILQRQIIVSESEMWSDCMLRS